MLVNDAGVVWGAPTLDYPLEGWDKVFAVNVRGLWLLSQRVARHMRDAGGGAIVHVSSISGMRGAWEHEQAAIAYNASKGAVLTLTKDMAVKLAPHRIRVNGIAPGPFRTDMMRHLTVDEETRAPLPHARAARAERRRGRHQGRRRLPRERRGRVRHRAHARRRRRDARAVAAAAYFSASPERIRQSCLRMNSTLPGSWQRTRSGSRSSGASEVAFAHQLPAASFAEAAVLPPLPFEVKKSVMPPPPGFGFCGGLRRGLLLLRGLLPPRLRVLVHLGLLLASSSSRIGQPVAESGDGQERGGETEVHALDDRKVGRAD